MFNKMCLSITMCPHPLERSFKVTESRSMLMSSQSVRPITRLLPNLNSVPYIDKKLLAKLNI